MLEAQGVIYERLSPQLPEVASARVNVPMDSLIEKKFIKEEADDVSYLLKRMSMNSVPEYEEHKAKRERGIIRRSVPALSLRPLEEPRTLLFVVKSG